MSPARTIFLTALLALAVAVLERGLIRLVQASGASAQPAVILVLLLSAFLGLLTAVLTRSMRLPGVIAATALVLGWILVPAVLGAVPGEALSAFRGNVALDSRESIALVVAVIAATVTLGVQADHR